MPRWVAPGERERAPKRKRMIQLGIVLTFLLIVGLLWWWVTTLNYGY